MLTRRIAVTDSGTFNGIAATTVTPGTAIVTDNISPGTLSVYADVTANTNTLTITVLWQVSMDGTTWVTCTPVNNAANVVLATGTGNNVTGDKIYPAPSGLEGWKYVRAAVMNGVAQGAAADTYALTARYVRRNPFSMS